MANDAEHLCTGLHAICIPFPRKCLLTCFTQFLFVVWFCFLTAEFSGAFIYSHLCLVGDDISLHTCVYSSTFWWKSLKEFHLSRKGKTYPGHLLLICWTWEVGGPEETLQASGLRSLIRNLCFPRLRVLLQLYLAVSRLLVFLLGGGKGSESLSSACTRGWTRGFREWMRSVCCCRRFPQSAFLGFQCTSLPWVTGWILALPVELFVCLILSSDRGQFIHAYSRTMLPRFTWGVTPLQQCVRSHLPPYWWYRSYFLVIICTIYSLGFVLCSDNPS